MAERVDLCPFLLKIEHKTVELDTFSIGLFFRNSSDELAMQNLIKNPSP